MVTKHWSKHYDRHECFGKSNNNYDVYNHRNGCQWLFEYSDCDSDCFTVTYYKRKFSEHL